MLSVTIIQSNLFWEDVDQNLKQFEIKINLISKKTDVIVLSSCNQSKWGGSKSN